MRFIRTGFCCLFICVLISVCPEYSAADGVPLRQENEPLEQYLERTRTYFDLPAIAAAAVRSDRILEAAAVGVRRRGDSARVTIDDCFHVGSLTKAMTATLGALLVQKGEISWPTTPAALFPELRDSINPAFDGITLQALLMHRAGIPPYTHSLHDFDTIPLPPGPVKQRRHRFAIRQLQQKPFAPPGEYNYSNAGYAIAAAMMEEATGQSWEELITRLLFEPLGLTTAGFGWPARDDPDQPWGHGRWHGEEKVIPHPPGNDWKYSDLCAPGTDVHMSIIDLAQFARMHLQGLQGKDNLLPAETIRFLHRPSGQYAMGWFVESIDGATCSWHSGSGGTFLARMTVEHEADLAVVVCINAVHENAREACRVVTSELLRLYSE